VSFKIAPPTRTRSVVKNRALAAAYAGAHRFGVEVFDPGTANTLMAALLVHDLAGGSPRQEFPAIKRIYALYDKEPLLESVQIDAPHNYNQASREAVFAPRVITSNGKEAVIEQGTEIPYQESASSGATTTQFKKAVLSLKVTPQITPDDRVILDLTVSKDSVGQILPSATGGSVPSIDTREITTQVLVNDGQTVVLGGILETERRDTVNKVPFLGDIPGLGVLFRSKGKTDNKDELLIFVTPKILREGAEIY